MRFVPNRQFVLVEDAFGRLSVFIGVDIEYRLACVLRGSGGPGTITNCGGALFVYEHFRINKVVRLVGDCARG